MLILTYSCLLVWHRVWAPTVLGCKGWGLPYTVSSEIALHAFTTMQSALFHKQLPQFRQPGHLPMSLTLLFACSCDSCSDVSVPC